MTARGVLISCPASVMNCFCFSKLSITGRTARREKTLTSTSTTKKLAAATPQETAR